MPQRARPSLRPLKIMRAHYESVETRALLDEIHRVETNRHSCLWSPPRNALSFVPHVSWASCASLLLQRYPEGRLPAILRPAVWLTHWGGGHARADADRGLGEDQQQLWSPHPCFEAEHRARASPPAPAACLPAAGWKLERQIVVVSSRWVRPHIRRRRHGAWADLPPRNGERNLRRRWRAGERVGPDRGICGAQGRRGGAEGRGERHGAAAGPAG